MSEEFEYLSNHSSIKKFSDIRLQVRSDSPRKRIQLVETKLVRKTSILYERRTIQTPNDAVSLLRKVYEEFDREYLFALYLTARREPIAIELISIGTLECTILSPKDVIKTALLCCAYGFIICHNHPSGGEIVLSTEDINATKRINEASKIMGLIMLDHLIITDISYISLKERGVF